MKPYKKPYEKIRLKTQESFLQKITVPSTSSQFNTILIQINIKSKHKFTYTQIINKLNFSSSNNEERANKRANKCVTNQMRVFK